MKKSWNVRVGVAWLGLTAMAAGQSEVEGGPSPRSARPPSFIVERLRAGPLSRSEAEGLVRQLSEHGYFGPPRSRADRSRPETEGATGTTPFDAWVAATLDRFPKDVELDQQTLHALFQERDFDQGGTLSFFELRNVDELPLVLFARIDADHSGAVEYPEFTSTLVLSARHAGYVVHDELMRAAAPDREASDAAAPLRTISAAWYRARQILTRAQTQLGRHDPTTAPRSAVESAPAPARATQRPRRAPIELANDVARRLYPLPDPRPESGSGWKPKRPAAGGAGSGSR